MEKLMNISFTPKESYVDMVMRMSDKDTSYFFKTLGIDIEEAPKPFKLYLAYDADDDAILVDEL